MRSKPSLLIGEPPSISLCPLLKHYTRHGLNGPLVLNIVISFLLWKLALLRSKNIMIVLRIQMRICLQCVRYLSIMLGNVRVWPSFQVLDPSKKIEHIRKFWGNEKLTSILKNAEEMVSIWVPYFPHYCMLKLCYSTKNVTLRCTAITRHYHSHDKQESQQYEKLAF